jgi:hypothetical protein
MSSTSLLIIIHFVDGETNTQKKELPEDTQRLSAETGLEFTLPRQGPFLFPHQLQLATQLQKG